MPKILHCQDFSQSPCDNFHIYRMTVTLACIGFTMWQTLIAYYRFVDSLSPRKTPIKQAGNCSHWRWELESESGYITCWGPICNECAGQVFVQTLRSEFEFLTPMQSRTWWYAVVTLLLGRRRWILELLGQSTYPNWWAPVSVRDYIQKQGGEQYLRKISSVNHRSPCMCILVYVCTHIHTHTCNM